MSIDKKEKIEGETRQCLVSPSIFSFLFLFFSPSLIFSQFESISIDAISIEGHKKTKDKIILRELDFTIGDSLSLENLLPRLKKNENLLLNTGLFTEVKINIKDWNGETSQVTISIKLKEAWYFFPIPLVELADRNFNVWWVEQNKSLKRINFGLYLFYNNVTGRNDLLKAKVQFGYTQKYELEYNLPFFNKAQTLGFKTSIFFSRNREIPYQTFENKLLFEFNDEYLLRRFRARFGLVYRPKLFTKQAISLAYNQNQISDYVAMDLNPDFFLNGKTLQQFFLLDYEIAIDRRDLKAYPLKGFLFYFNLRKTGLGIFKDINKLTISPYMKKYFSLNKKFSLELILRANASLIRVKEPYYNLSSLGYDDDYLRAYEYYVIEGSDYIYQKTSFRFELINRTISLGEKMPFQLFKSIPLRIYLSLNNDLGYVYDEYYATSNSFNNRILWGYGIGLDFVVYIDKVIQIELSRNHLSELGLFLHYKFSF